jgi:hypothetical protein
MEELSGVTAAQSEFVKRDGGAICVAKVGGFVPRAWDAAAGHFLGSRRTLY